MLDVDIGFFKRAPFFADFDNEALRLIVFSADAVELDDGEVLFKEGDLSDCGFLLVGGQIDLLQDGPTGRALVESVEPGTLIGETALLVETRRPATAVATGPTRLFRVSRRLLFRILREYPVLAERLHERFLARLIALAPEVADLAERLAMPGEPASEDVAAPDGFAEPREDVPPLAPRAVGDDSTDAA